MLAKPSRYPSGWPGRHAGHACCGRAGAGTAAGDQPLLLAEAARTRACSDAPAPTRCRPWCRARAARAGSRCRVRPGSPTACRARRSRSAASRARCRRALGPPRSSRGRPRSPRARCPRRSRRGCRRACRCRRPRRRRPTAPDRCARRPASGPSTRVRREPVLHVLGVHEADLAELARCDHLAGLPDHRIAGVVVREREDLARLRAPTPRASSLLAGSPSAACRR